MKPVTTREGGIGTRSGTTVSSEHDVARLRKRIDDRVNQLSERLMRRMGDAPGAEDARTAALQEELQLLGQLSAALGTVDADTLPASGAGFGSRVSVHDLDTGQRCVYTLMVGALVDIDAGQVSLASPVGQALIGRSPGAVVAVSLPHRTMRLRITGLTTLHELLEEPLRTA